MPNYNSDSEETLYESDIMDDSYIIYAPIPCSIELQYIDLTTNEDDNPFNNIQFIDNDGYTIEL